MNNLGERIIYCRNLLNLTRPEIVLDLETVTLSTYARWELNSIKIPEKRIVELIKYFNSHGVIVSSEWLRYGHGSIPILLSDDIINKVNFDEVALKVTEQIKISKPNFVFYQISNDDCKPILDYGDYVGGIIDINVNNLLNKLCFFKTYENIHIGNFEIYKEQFYLNNYSKLTNIILKQDTVIGVANWIMKRFC